MSQTGQPFETVSEGMAVGDPRQTWRLRSRDHDGPDARVVLAVVGQPEPLAHRAVHAVAADQPTRPDLRPAPLPVLEGGRDAPPVIGEVDEGAPALHSHPASR